MFESIIASQDLMSNLPSDTILFLALKIAVIIALSACLGRIYLLYGNSFSDRRNLSRGFMILSLVTFLVITVVKSSLALSLGLVGALSIVRFRTPIKEPEDLIYLFLSIAIGLGIGANQILITTFISLVIMLFLIAGRYFQIRDAAMTGITLTLESTKKPNFDNVCEGLSEFCSRVSLTTYEKGEGGSTIIFDIELQSNSSIEALVTKLETIAGKEVQISFTDSQYGRVF